MHEFHSDLVVHRLLQLCVCVCVCVCVRREYQAHCVCTSSLVQPVFLLIATVGLLRPDNYKNYLPNPVHMCIWYSCKVLD